MDCRRCERWKPDVVVLDVAIGGGEGFAVVKELPRWNPNLRVVAFTGLEDTGSVQRALRAGVCGYVTRRDPVAALIGAIIGALTGERRVGPRVEHMLLETLASGKVQMEDDDTTLLSERERQVFQLIGGGLRTSAVASELRLSVKTIETHRQRIKEKLRLRNGVELQHRATVFHAGRSDACSSRR
jgi:DNA-binding NarL/FixJ family response regulator